MTRGRLSVTSVN